MPERASRAGWLLAASLPVVLAVALAAPVPAHAELSKDPFEIWDDKTVLAALESAEDALKQELGSLPKKAPRILLSRREYIADVIYEGMRKRAGALGKRADRELRTQARVVARSLFGVYIPENHTIHLAPENFHAFAVSMGNEAFARSAFLEIVLAHELVHAWDVVHWGLKERDREKRTPEEHKIWFALMEGHANYVAEKAAKRRGLHEEFKMLIEASFFPPPGLTGLESQFAWRASADTRFGYVDGHRFFSALEAADDPDIIDKVFRKPPSSVSVILHPTRYFIPEETEHFPAVVPIEAALDAVLKQEMADAKISTVPFDEQSLKAHLVMLTPTRSAKALGTIVETTGRVALKDELGAYCAAVQTTGGDAAKELFQAIVDSEDMEAKAIAKAAGVKGDRITGPIRSKSTFLNNRSVRFVGEGKDVSPEYSLQFVAGPFVVECVFLGKKRDDNSLEDIMTFARGKLHEAATGKGPAPAMTPAVKKPAR